jgi:hypothetical protein
MNKDTEFWVKWHKGNCIEKHKLVDELIKGTQMDKFPIDATLLNSYFVDLAEYLIYGKSQ